MKRRTLSLRLGVLMIFLCLVMTAFFGILWDLQINHQADYAQRLTKPLGVTETVPAARGEIVDRYGRNLVTNQVVYQVTLNTNLMGEDQNRILLELIHTAQEHGVTWPDNLPLTTEDPCFFNIGSVSEGSRKNYVKLSGELGWKETKGPALLAELRKFYGMDKDISDADARLLAGVRYELSLRTKEITWAAYVFATDVDMDFISAVRERSLAGVVISPVTTRKYSTTYAAHILGRTTRMDAEDWKIYKEKGYAMNETVGKDGVERAFESLLRGQAGKQLVERNAKGKIVSHSWKTEPAPGYNVSLTIDLPLQQKVEDTLAAKLPTLTDDGAGGGAAVMIDVNNGDILSMASYPTFDLTTVYKNTELYNAAATNSLEPFLNRATDGMYAPGSTFKPMVATAALQEGVITPSTRITDTGVYRYYSSPQPACWLWRQSRATHGSINVSKAIEVSCNVFFYETGRLTGIRTIDDYAAKFGLGQPTGIELPERIGVVAGPDYTTSRGQTWYEGNVMSAAIGQENNQFTPLQMANYAATLANGGTHYAAHLLKSVKSNDYSETIETYEPKVLDQIDIDPVNLHAIHKGMIDLTTTGSLRGYFRNLDVTVAAKTGSVQVAGQDTSNATFICFAPAEDPQVALAIVAQKGGSGSGLAGLAADILDYYFNAQNGFTTAAEENTLLR